MTPYRLAAKCWGDQGTIGRQDDAPDRTAPAGIPAKECLADSRRLTGSCLKTRWEGTLM